ncbi:MAG: hypothetical protein CMH17_01105 [Methylophaga sp.]|jgi:hypothetical protein|nr:hypothetical protein [Methylophaga sp.]|tara:strand:- start:4188 stop:4412 length:225 start_codon:yes stop_codon:yes gene_type:complete
MFQSEALFMLTIILLLAAYASFSLAPRHSFELFGTAIGAFPNNHVLHFADWRSDFYIYHDLFPKFKTTTLMNFQ